MKRVQQIVIAVFLCVLLIPVLSMNTEPDVKSAIDNRKLAENPFTNPDIEDLSLSIEDYVQDRIGFRDPMIMAYTVLNDVLFKKMVHPSYVYGKEGYVFGAGLNQVEYGEFHELFADAIEQMQEYCESRDIPFLFVFEPTKPEILREYIPAGIQYNSEWVELFLQALDDRGVHYIDNTELLLSKTEQGISVFNKKYDANHWNYEGALFGTNHILETLRLRLPSVYVNQEEDLIREKELKTTLPVSNFPIHEFVPSIRTKAKWENITDRYIDSEDLTALRLNKDYQTFGYWINEERVKNGGVKALFFQGSYINSYGSNFLVNALGEYIFVHDYQNVLALPYYVGVFQPEAVVFEVAEYTLTNGFFSEDVMEDLDFNPPIKDLLMDYGEPTIRDIEESEITILRGKTLTDIYWDNDMMPKYSYLVTGDGREYDFQKVEEPDGESRYVVTLSTEDLERTSSLSVIYLTEDGEIEKIDLRDLLKS